jgi:hypothetical protein
MRRSGISDLRDIVRIPKESIFRIRNMGDATYKELQEQCDKYGIVIRSEKDVIDRSRGIKWFWQQCSRLFEMGIRSIEDIKTFPMEEVEKIKFSMPEIYGQLKDAKRKLESYDFCLNYVTKLTKLEGGQKLVRFYDPSGNLIEVRTPVNYN